MKNYRSGDDWCISKILSAFTKEVIVLKQEKVDNAEIEYLGLILQLLEHTFMGQVYVQYDTFIKKKNSKLVGEGDNHVIVR